MLSSITSSFARLGLTSSARSAASSSSSSSSAATAFTSTRSLHLSTTLRPTLRPSSSLPPTSINLGSIRHRSQLAPRRTKYRKAHKIRLPFPTGGSLKGTTVQEGVYGIRLLAPAKLTAKQLVAAETALKRKLKVIKGAQVFLRVFPDVPVCVKGNETRMGKGKGAFEYWACSAAMGKVIFEIGGPVEIRQEIAQEALRLASAKLPVPTEFVTAASAPRLGHKVLTSSPPPTPAAVAPSATVDSITTTQEPVSA